MNKSNIKYRWNIVKSRPYNKNKYYYYKSNINYPNYKRKKSNYINYNYIPDEPDEEYYFQESIRGINDKTDKDFDKNYTEEKKNKEYSLEKSLKTKSNSNSNSRKQSYNNINNNNSSKEKNRDKGIKEKLDPPDLIIVEKNQEKNFCEKNSNINNKNNKNENNISLNNDKENVNDNLNILNNNPNPNTNNLIKINLSQNDIKNAFYKPKHFKEEKNNNIISKTNIFTNYKYEIENTVILDVNIKLSKDKIIRFKLHRFDDMFKVIKEIINKNRLSENFMGYFVCKIIKALNSIYGIYNLNLKEDEINYLKELKKKCKYNK